MDGASDTRSTKTLRRRVLGEIGFGVVCGFADCLGSTETDRRTVTEQFSVSGDSVDCVVVHGGDGEIVVRGWEGSDVRVEATKFALGETDLSAVTVTRDVTAGRLSIAGEVPRGFSCGASGGGIETLDGHLHAGMGRYDGPSR